MQEMISQKVKAHLLTIASLCVLLGAVPLCAQSVANSATHSEEFDWKGALRDSAFFLGVQHGFRLTERVTRREFDGKFFPDWKHSITHTKDGFFDGSAHPIKENFLGHPAQGAVSYHIARHRGASRKVAFLWTTLYSVQFEIGPVSEASLGNVRLSPQDLVFTPLLGTGEALLEEWVDGKINLLPPSKKRTLLRCLLLTKSVANLMRFKHPAYRGP